MTIEERLTTVAENVPKVYDSGRIKGYYEAGYENGKAEEQAITDAILTRKITEYSNDRVLRIGNAAFQFCDNLTGVNIPNARNIGTYSFRYCANLTHVKFPLVENINSYAFQGSTALMSVDFAALKRIDAAAFDSCQNLTAVILRSTGCTLSNSNAFSNTPIASGTGYIYVPAALVDSYKTATNWSAYADKIRAIEDMGNDTATITFTVLNDGDYNKYTAEEGMTWETFVGSEYNPDDEYGNKMFSVSEGDVFYLYTYGDYGPELSVVVSPDTTENVKSSDPIDAELYYIGDA